MRPIPAAVLIAGATLAACRSGRVEPTNRGDTTPPVVRLTVSAVDPETNRLQSTEVEAGGTGARLAAKPGQVIISASASDSSGVKRVSVWTIGDTLTDPARGEVVNTAREAYRNTSTLATMTSRLASKSESSPALAISTRAASSPRPPRSPRSWWWPAQVRWSRCPRGRGRRPSAFSGATSRGHTWRKGSRLRHLARRLLASARAIPSVVGGS